MSRHPVIFVDHLLRDVSHSLRRLSTSSRFTLPTVSLLSLGTTVAIGTVGAVYAVAVRPAPIVHGADLVVVAQNRPPSTTLRYLSYPNFADVRERSTFFKRLVAYEVVDFRVAASGLSVEAHGQAVSGNYFRALQVGMERGHTLSEADDSLAAPPVAILSDAFWRRAFAGAESEVGQTILVNGHPFVIAGIADKPFHGTDGLFEAEVWVPFSAAQSAGIVELTDRTARNVRVQGFLSAGVTQAAAQGPLDAIATGLRLEYPVENRNLRLYLRPERDTRPIIDAAGQVLPMGVFLIGVALAGLSIDGASVAGLLLVRSLSRRRELLTCLALGATRARIVQLVAVEGFLISLASGGLGVAGAALGLGALSKVRLPDGIAMDFRPDGVVMCLAVVLCIVVGVAVSVIPALTATRQNSLHALSGNRATTNRSSGRHRERIVASQFAVLTALIAIASALAGSVKAADKSTVGFPTANRLLLTVAPEEFGFDPGRGQLLVESFLNRVITFPGVESAAGVAEPPFGMASSSVDLEPVGAPPLGPLDRIAYTVVTPGYFRTLAIPFLRGRDFDLRDGPRAPSVVIINQTLAGVFWPGEEALGKQIQVPGDLGARAVFDVVGVVATTKYASPSELPRGFIWFPYAQLYRGSMAVAIRVRDQTIESDILTRARAALAALDNSLAFSNVTTLDKAVNDRAGGTVAEALFVGVVALLAFVRATFSLYSTLRYNVHFRAREIAVRIALGACARDTYALVVTRAMTLAVVGVVLGLALAFGVVRELRSVLTVPIIAGPWTWIRVPILVLVVAVIAACLPVREFLKSNPTRFLRSD